jgi:tetratricopeptide (TPR) repeat protein
VPVVHFIRRGIARLGRVFRTPAERRPGVPRGSGLWVTVRLQGAVVAEEIHRFGWWRVRLGRSVPTDSGGRFATARWLDRSAVEVAPEQGEPRRLAVGDAWRWERPNGVSVEVGLVPAHHLPVRVASSGDLTFLLTFAMLSALAAQIAFLLFVMFPGGAAAPVPDPTPELIARLLQEDYAGAEEGSLQEDVARPELSEPGASYYLPSGNKGPLDRYRGGERQGPEIVRTQPTDEEREPVARELPESPDAVDESETATETETLAADAPPEPQAPQDPQRTRVRVPKAAPADPIERFIGWGFRDWMDRGAAKDVDPELERTLTLARVRLRLDPNDPYALQVVGYYAYLAEEMELSRAVYQRYVTLNEDDPAGYNNLALTYKRLGEYDEEEALYRRALELDPVDDHVLNNLAVNLAHQGRSDEALEIMDRLEVLTPDDPYAGLHRAKIYATMGKRDKAYKYLKQALERTELLDTLHHIEFRQDIRIDPAFQLLRHESKFQDLIRRFYGDDAKQLLGKGWRAERAPERGGAGG